MIIWVINLQFVTVGASVVNPSDLKFLYEGHEDFVALPTYFILAGMCMESPIVAQSMPPGKHADFTNVSVMDMQQIISTNLPSPRKFVEVHWMMY